MGGVRSQELGIRGKRLGFYTVSERLDQSVDDATKFFTIRDDLGPTTRISLLVTDLCLRRKFVC